MIIPQETDSPIAKEIILRQHTSEYLFAFPGPISVMAVEASEPPERSPYFILVYEYVRALGPEYSVYRFSCIRNG